MISSGRARLSSPIVPLGELVPRVGFIVTDLTWWPKNVVGFYNQRGTAEQWIKDGKNAVKWSLLRRSSLRLRRTNATVVPGVQGQRSVVLTLRAGLQPGQLPAASCPAQEHPSLVAHYAGGEAGEDRREDRPALPLRGLPVRRGCSAQGAVRCHPRSHPAACTGPQMMWDACSASGWLRCPNKSRIWERSIERA